ncbi:MAG TPA: sigma-70 region 4 domain-containing protein, partial [Gaiellaceae bacterium]|nr:sigma-70 region 4 domain-containing protein [Gaiellaceae bacterium]
RRRSREERAQLGMHEDVGDPALAEGFGFSPELDDGLRALTAAEREVVALRIILELDGEETARLLGITPTAVSTRLHRALGKLEERMRNHESVA